MYKLKTLNKYMLNKLPYDIFIEIMLKIYNLEHYNLIYLQRLMIIEKNKYEKSYDIIRDMLKNILPIENIINYNQLYFKRSDWWLKLLYFNKINICNCFIKKKMKIIIVNIAKE